LSALSAPVPASLSFALYADLLPVLYPVLVSVLPVLSSPLSQSLSSPLFILKVDILTRLRHADKGTMWQETFSLPGLDRSLVHVMKKYQFVL